MNHEHPTTIEFLQDQQSAERFLEAIGEAPGIALDTEAASFHRYHDRVYLLQLSTRTRTAVIDPLRVTELSRLGTLLAEPGVEIVFHDADYDLRMLHRDYGFRVTTVFDTRIAAQLVNEPGIGLAALLEKYLGVKQDKKFQRADWSRRPLLPGMLEYAATDTHHLLALRDILERKLKDLGRLEWAREEFRLLENVSWAAVPAEEAFWKLKGARQLRGPALAVLRALHRWRDQRARELDRAPFRVMNNETLVEIAKALPRDRDQLRRIRGISDETLRRRGGEVLNAVEAGLAVPQDQLPRAERGRGQRPEPEFLDRVERLKTVRNLVAQELDLAPGVLCPNGTLEAIARMEPKSVDDLARVEEMRTWQRSVLGERLLRAIPAPAPGGEGGR